jgi:hypothetical protein
MTAIEMNRTIATRDPWRPKTGQDQEAILLELQEVLASPHFCNSKRYPALLKYIVENTLAGKADLLKERTLGVEVFDRSPSYDTNADTVVRYTAGEVRKRLSLYYHELDRKPVIQISLPAGSYIPEFLHLQDELGDSTELADPSMAHMVGTGVPRGSVGSMEPDTILPWALPDSGLGEGAKVEVQQGSGQGSELGPDKGRGHAKTRRGWWVILAAMLAIAVVAGLGWKYRTASPQSAADNFWLPVVRNQEVVMVCTGGSVFAKNNFSGVTTAGKDIDYPFISMQSASAIAQLSGLLERNGAKTQLQSAATTPLTELRERPVIFLGGYNNPWTLRLLQPLRFHFSPEAVAAAIVDAAHPGVRWERDHSLPYSSADDYALVARFRDTTTDSWVVALAGLGRNGTEAAAEFVTSPHYMQMLRDQVGSDFSNRNVEVVLKVNVVDGKTGAPSILTSHAW